MVRFVEITHALGVDPLEVLARAHARVFHPGRPPGWNVDLITAARIEDPDLAPLRQWARSRLAESLMSGGETAVVFLDVAALEALASLCGLEILDLARRLPHDC